MARTSAHSYVFGHGGWEYFHNKYAQNEVRSTKIGDLGEMKVKLHLIAHHLATNKNIEWISEDKIRVKKNDIFENLIRYIGTVVYRERSETPGKPLMTISLNRTLVDKINVDAKMSDLKAYFDAWESESVNSPLFKENMHFARLAYDRMRWMHEHRNEESMVELIA